MKTKNATRTQVTATHRGQTSVLITTDPCIQASPFLSAPWLQAFRAGKPTATFGMNGGTTLHYADQVEQLAVNSGLMPA